MKRLVRIGNLDEDLRAKFWINQMPFFTFQNEVCQKIGMENMFANAYEFIVQKLKDEKPLTDRVVNEIGKLGF